MDDLWDWLGLTKKLKNTNKKQRAASGICFQ